MTKLKDLAIKDLNNFDSIEMAKLYDFMQVIKDKKAGQVNKWGASLFN